jgi:hypothetical protein
MARRLARLCAREPTERALWPRARFRSLYVSMLRLTLELSGLQMRRTPTVAIVANGASASLLTGLLPPVARGAHRWRPGKQRSKLAMLVHPPWPKHGGSTCSLPPFAAERCLSAPSCPHPRLNASVNRRLAVQVLCCCVAPGDALALRPVSEAADTRG